jgi:hypothetical protein
MPDVVQHPRERDRGAIPLLDAVELAAPVQGGDRGAGQVIAPRACSKREWVAPG